MPSENIIFKVLFDTTEATKQVQSLDGVMENATKQVDEFTKNVKGGADGLNNLAKAKKTFTDISMVESTTEVKQLAAELGNATAKQNDFGKAGKQVVDDYKKGKIDQVQATKQLADAIDKGVDATKKMEAETVKVAGGIKSYRAQIADLKQILPTLEGAEYTKAQAKLAQLTDAMGDQQAQIKLLASDTRGLDTAMQGLQLGVGIFAGLQGASALFGAENEDVQKALLKVNGAMAVLQSLQQIQNTLDKESGFVNSVKLYWKQLLTTTTIAETAAIDGNVVATEASTIVGAENAAVTAVQTTSTGAYGLALTVVQAIQTRFAISSAAAWAIATGGLALLVAGVVALGLAFRDAGKEQAEYAKNQKLMNDVRKDAMLSVVDEKVKLEQLLKVANDEHKTKLERKDAIKQLNEISPEYLGNLTLENIKTIQSTTSINLYVEALNKKAMNEAIYNKKVELNKKMIEAESKSIEENISWTDKLQASIISGGNVKAANALLVGAGAVGKAKEISLIQDEINKLDALVLAQERQANLKDKLKNMSQSAVGEIEKVKEVKVKVEKIKLEPVNDKFEITKMDKFIEDLKDTPALSKPIVIDTAINITDITGFEEVLKMVNDFRTNLKTNLSFIGGDFEQIFGKVGDEIANSLDLKNISNQVSLARKQVERDRQQAKENEKNAANLTAEQRKEQAQRDKEAIADSQKKLDDAEASQKKKIGALITGALSIVSSGLGLVDQAIDRSIAKMDKAIEYQRTAVERARQIADKGNSQLLDAEEKKLLRLEQLRRQESKKKKAIAISEAIVNTAIAVTSALTALPPLSFIMAALAGALGAVQVGVIASQQFAKGGFTGDGTGKRDNTGHIPVGIVHDNEFVLDKEYTTKNRNELEYIHKNRIPLSEILKNNQVPIMAFNNTLSNLQVNSNGQLEDRMRAVENAIIDLPNRMPRTSFNADSRGLSMKVTEIATKEKQWRK